MTWRHTAWHRVHRAPCGVHRAQRGVQGARCGVHGAQRGVHHALPGRVQSARRGGAQSAMWGTRCARQGARRAVRGAGCGRQGARRRQGPAGLRRRRQPQHLLLWKTLPALAMAEAAVAFGTGAAICF